MERLCNPHGMELSARAGHRERPVPTPVLVGSPVRRLRQSAQPDPLVEREPGKRQIRMGAG
ncbi:hypothetical protein [Sulfobacillus harzensis]|uniref:Uncharacterized protein n=1 Tax=Sulfobacillus harzensis TaxID=2729629 RepID=A0A7Y0L1X6_9FIRM|nr:hypothetical protein [Sulfobacillus harzensis]NMP21568.1 hypothetical protein [Sulfobacillus harzensis]